MKNKLIQNFRAPRWLGVMAAIGASCTAAWAGTFFTDFNTDPTTVLNFCGTLWDGVTTTGTGSANWQTNGGAGPAYLTTNGPVAGVTNDGFLQITFADHNCAGALSTYLTGGVLFDDFDHGLIVQAFTFECDLRIGNGNPNPADGFSISYVRANDPVLAGIAAGYTLSDMNNTHNLTVVDLGYQFADNGGSGDPSLMEEGTLTGLSIGFDMWDSGNYTIPPVSPSKGTELPGLTHDGIGLDIRVDGVLQTTISMPNGTTQATSDEYGNALTAADTDGATASTDPKAIETGPYDATGCDTNLFWCHLKVVLDTNQVLNVWWKNVQILTNFQTTFAPSAGRLLMAARVGGNTANIEVDNVGITTIPATKPLVGTATGYPDGCSVNISDSGTGVDISKPYSLVVNGITVTGATISKSGIVTTVAWHGYPELLVSGSTTNSLTVTVEDTSGAPVSGTRSFNVPVYNSVPAAWAVTISDTTKLGVQMRTWQSSFENNINWWAQEQLAGLHGTNEADTSSFTDNGFFDFITGPGPVGVINMDYDGNTDGIFTANNGYPENLWPGLTPAANGLLNIDFAAADIQCWLQFPAGGVYTFGVNSDDGFKVTTGPNPSDWGAMNIGEFNGGRGAGGGPVAGTYFSFVVTNAGVYPFRLMWENGTGGANCEWYSVVPWYGTPGVAGCYQVLVGDPDPTNKTGIVAYYAGPAKPAWVSWLYPTPNSTIGDPILVKASITDAGTTVTPGSIQLSVDGTALAATNQAAGGVTTVTAYRSAALAAGAHTAQLVYTTTGTGGGTFTNTWTYTVPSYTVLNTAWAVTGVDPTKPGFLVRPWQAGTQPNTIWWTEEQMQGIYGANTADLADPDYPNIITKYANSYYIFTNNINWDNGTGSDGNFYPNNDYANIFFPGSDEASTWNNSSEEVLTYVYFDHPGLFTMYVNSDDGFKVTTGPSPADWLTSVIVGQNGGVSTTTFSVLVSQAGFYPFRLLYENGTGGFYTEWGMVQSTGTPNLINDPRTAGEFGGAAAYYSGPLFPAFVSMAEPYPGDGPVRPDALFQVNLTDGSTTVSSSSVKVYINGKQLTQAIVAKSGVVTSVTMPAGYLLPGNNDSLTDTASDTAAVVYTTTGAGGGTFSNFWNFTVIPWGGVDPAWAATGVDNTKPGFKMHPWKSSGEGNASQPNTIRWTEEQQAGAHGSNHADLTGADANGYLTFAGADLAHTINFDLVGSHDGNFQPNGTATAMAGYPDNPWPGSDNATSWDNSSQEIIGYMYFNAPGLYQFGVNSDDGFKVTVGANPKDWLNSTVLGYYNGGKGSSDVTYFVNVTNAGYYPMRLLWENGGGGCNCEWFSYGVGDTTTRYLVNDPNPTNQSGVAFYYVGPQLPAYVAEFWPDNGATGVQDGWVSLTLKDGSTTVNASSIAVTVNGVAVTPTISSSGGTTKISSPMPFPPGTYTVNVTYSTSGGGPYTATWSFTTVAEQWGYATLSTNLWTPPGSGSNPGFAMKAFQTLNTNIFDGWQNMSRMADMAIQGLYGPNLADLTDYTNNGEMWWPGVINFSQNSSGARTDNGAFQTTDGYTDATVPGAPRSWRHRYG